jgi:hypothetical protein
VRTSLFFVLLFYVFFLRFVSFPALFFLVGGAKFSFFLVSVVVS